MATVHRSTARIHHSTPCSEVTHWGNIHVLYSHPNRPALAPRQTVISLSPFPHSNHPFSSSHLNFACKILLARQPIGAKIQELLRQKRKIFLFTQQTCKIWPRRVIPTISPVPFALAFYKLTTLVTCNSWYLGSYTTSGSSCHNNTGYKDSF